MNSLLKSDKQRYTEGRVPKFQRFFRKAQSTRFPPLKYMYRFLFKIFRDRRCIDLSVETKIGEGLYFGHPYCITVNPKAIIGKNCNIDKGVTIGQENRGHRKGTPVIGDSVWIGINATLVGKVRIGNDVLIAPNSYVNCDVPDHSIVFRNPCVIKRRENATEMYINRTV